MSVYLLCAPILPYPIGMNQGNTKCTALDEPLHSHSILVDFLEDKFTPTQLEIEQKLKYHSVGLQKLY